MERLRWGVTAIVGLAFAAAGCGGESGSGLPTEPPGVSQVSEPIQEDPDPWQPGHPTSYFTFPDGVSPGNCSGTDADGDGLTESCEHQIAHTVRPRLHFSADESHSDRESFWAVTPIESGRTSNGINKVSVFYFMGYHDDAQHRGDTEFVILDLSADGGWHVSRVFTSAHWRSGGDSSEDSGGANFTYYDDGRPFIYVAEGKHANYRTDWECDGGSVLGWDTCDEPFTDEDVEVLSDRNLGDVQHPLINCVSISSSFYLGTECFFEPGDKFLGWWDLDSGGSTPPLEAITFFESRADDT